MIALHNGLLLNDTTYFALSEKQFMQNFRVNDLEPVKKN
jgi:hypothetical protein